MDRAGRLTVAASQRRDIVADELVTGDEAAAAVWAVADGVKVGGARAFGLALAVAWSSRLPMLVWRLPLVPAVLDRLYEIVALNRYRLPGTEPWCGAHPGACVDQARSA